MSYLFRVLLASIAGLVVFAMLLVLLAFLLSGGSDETSSAPAADRWLGRWNGPEGTFLLLEGGRGTYRITVRDLDGPRVFQGTAVGDRVQFERDGVTETLDATDGAGTGMKWLSDKKDCLTIRFGEGYCRD